MDLGLAGRVAVVCASSRGLGRASADALAAEGARLVIGARGEASLREAEEQLRAGGTEVVGVLGDMAEPGVPESLVAAALTHYGRLDVVVANAGGPPPGGALDLSDAAIGAALEANFLSSVRLVRAALPHLRQGGWGRICCITSYTIIQAAPVLALSNSARSALWAWAKTAAHDLAAEGAGITVNLVCPGPHATERMRSLGAGDDAVMGDPADLGRVVAFLCSEPAGYVNGAALLVDGGATLAL
ncbi:MAG TPA: SDR family oxidoreductase [Acidimicrobiales bacterium]|nr:SDR family oxidoreductase [Acidimicrobiales bacterium]